MGICGVVFIVLSIITGYEYGPDITSSLIDKISTEKTSSSYLIRICYLLGLLCHVPFVFFGAKLSFLVVVEEIWNRTLTKQIDECVEKHNLE